VKNVLNKIKGEEMKTNKLILSICMMIIFLSSVNSICYSQEEINNLNNKISDLNESNNFIINHLNLNIEKLNLQIKDLNNKYQRRLWIEISGLIFIAMLIIINNRRLIKKYNITDVR